MSSQTVQSKFVVPSKPLPRLVIEGDPKIGKTAFAASAPSVAMIMGEDGAQGLEVPQLRVRTWNEVLDAVKTLRDDEHDFKWAAIDTANSIETMCAEVVCNREFNGVWNTKKGVEGFNAYGKGDKSTAQEFRQLLSLLDELQQKRNMGVILLCHVGLHKTGNALGADFMKFGGNLNKYTWALVAGWADQIGYATREMRVSTREGETKAKANAISAERWIMFEGSPGLDAGVRAGYEMPERILLDWEEYERQLKTDHVKALINQARELLDVVQDGAREKVAQRLGGQITEKKLRELGKQKLNTLIGWLLTQQQRNGQKEAA